ncbi:Scr1 family TA system antitoxin-like transcriptional regulator [Streptomyces sp. SL13]|uniref:Scr1 family TA system antitoxin-like transcriptional regulator n=1 Tax=Streptantibioticus silvisoli TaxID=2705255 RepID=A0AA90GXF2_9ACTN|nr:Scr1 family TA system antitoxin-like transcriptional regulator [Streptantibioticus silvisoli]MDI5969903.1 Scr1 family TA system antitoxin-like transcriptional regulator [Streptantibioticus silvisoli]
MNDKNLADEGLPPDAPDAVLRLAGAILGRWRKHIGLSQEEFGMRIGYGSDMVASVELGRRVPSVSYLIAAEVVCDAHGTISLLEPHVRQRPRSEQEVRRAEECSSALSYFAPVVLPDLFVIDTDDSTTGDRTWLRRGRQILESGTRICLVLDQAVLLRVVSDRTAHGHQLQYLADLAERPHIVVQVSPLDGGEYLPFTAPVTLMQDGDQLTGFVDAGLAKYWLGPEGAREAERRFADLRSAALPPRASRDLILSTVDRIGR